MSVYILDCETTGTSKSDQVIELAYLEVSTLHEEFNELAVMDLSKIDMFPNVVDVYQYLPTCPINPHAHAVHGITRAMLAGKPLSSSVEIPTPVTYIIGHNIQFDIRMLGQSNKKLISKLASIKTICTLDLARLLSKHFKLEYENHKLDTLLHHYYPEYSHLLIKDTHSAQGDVVKNLLVLLKLVSHLTNVQTWDDLYSMQENIKNIK